MKKKITTISIFTAVLLTLFSIVALGSGGNGGTRYGRSTLTGNTAEAYDLIVEGVMKEVPDETIEFPSNLGLSLDELRKAYSIFSYDYPECFWLGSNYSYSRTEDEVILGLKPNYSFRGSELTEARVTLDLAVDEILLDMPNGTDYEKALFLHDAIAKTTDYQMVGEHQTVWGALVEKKAVCAGYAAAYQLLLNRAGIDAFTVSGVSYDPKTREEVPHAWNLVWIDGECVYTDVTWDDQGDDLYHSYFNLSKSEISVDHIINDDLFTLPECDHYDQGYFDLIGFVITDFTTADEAAAIFDTTKENQRTASALYTGGNFSAWLSDRFSDLYFALGGKSTPAASYSFTSLGGEFHIKIVGDMPVMSHSVSILCGENMSADGTVTQLVKAGEEIDEIIFTADDGYYFGVDYPTTAHRGITVERIDYTHLRAYGRPTSSFEITLSAPQKKLKLEAPETTFTANGNESGILSGLGALTRYSIDGGEVWLSSSEETVTIAKGISEEMGILVKNSGDEFTTEDSEIQQIKITKPKIPLGVISHAVTESGADGRISGVSTLMEYKTPHGAWKSCFSEEITSLNAGTYLVRIKANGTSLASESLSVTVGKSTDIAANGITLIITPRLQLGESYTAQFNLTPADAVNKTVYFFVDDESVLEIDAFSGTVTPRSRGTAKITVVTQDGGYTDEIDLTVFCTHEGKVPDATVLPDCRAHESYFACSACGQLFDSEGTEIGTVPTRHLYGTEIKCDGEYHWYECSCGEVSSKGKHHFGEKYELTGEDGESLLATTCDICEYTVYEELTTADEILSFVKKYILVIAVAVFFGIVAIAALVKRKK